MLTTPNTLAAYLLLQIGEEMPDPIYDGDGNLDIEADNAALSEWSHQPEQFTADLSQLQRFIDRTEVLLTHLQHLTLTNEEQPNIQYMTLFYDAAKDTFDQDKSMIRTYFVWLYLVVFQKQEGPRWGDTVNVMGVDAFVELARRRFGELIVSGASVGE